MTPTESSLSLRECAARLGVHYMTVYRYVRTGMLPAHKEGSTWVVDPSDVEALERGPAPDQASRSSAPWDIRFRDVCLRGDDLGAWRVIESALAGGMDPVDIHLKVIAPAMNSIGDLWAKADIGIADEHVATGVAMRSIGRLGPRFRGPGRRRGTIVMGAPSGERHGLAVALNADLLRAHGWEVVDLGCDLPASEIADAVESVGEHAVVGFSVTMTEHLEALGEAIATLRSRGPWRIALGGAAVDGHSAERFGADLVAPDGALLAEALAV